MTSKSSVAAKTMISKKSAVPMQPSKGPKLGKSILTQAIKKKGK